MTMLLKVTLVHNFAGIVVENTFGLEAGDGTIPQDVADAVAATMNVATWLAGRSDSISFTSVRVEDDTPGLAATGEVIFSVPLTGDDAANALPPLNALVVQWRASAKGRNGRGRLYLAGFPASTAIGGYWTSDAQDPASAAASLIFDNYGPAGSGQLCIINRRSLLAALVPHQPSLIKAFSISNIVHQQSRRQALRGI